jgi:hypothetical protein
MKRCPQCNQIFTDDNFFCLNDGTSLLYNSNTVQNPPVFQTSSDAPTLVVSRPQENRPSSGNGSSKWLYLVIGVMGTTLVAMAVFMFLLREKNEKSEIANPNPKIEQISKTVEVAAEILF